MARMQQASLVICVDQLEDIFRAYEEGPMSAMRDMFRRAVLTECTISDLMNGLLRVFAPFPKQHRPSHILRDHRQESARMPESSRFLVLSSRYTTVMTMHRLISMPYTASMKRRSIFAPAL